MTMVPTGREALLSSGGKMRWVKAPMEVSRACEIWAQDLTSFWRTNFMEEMRTRLASERSWLPTVGWGSPQFAPQCLREEQWYLHAYFSCRTWVVSKYRGDFPLVGLPAVCFCPVLVPTEASTGYLVSAPLQIVLTFDDRIKVTASFCIVCCLLHWLSTSFPPLNNPVKDVPRDQVLACSSTIYLCHPFTDLSSLRCCHVCVSTRWNLHPLESAGGLKGHCDKSARWACGCVSG